MGGDTWSHTTKGKGEWWQVSFKERPYWVERVRVLNIPTELEEEGQRLAETEVYVDDQLCGSLPEETVGGEWYTVICGTEIESKSLFGWSIRLVTV